MWILAGLLFICFTAPCLTEMRPLDDYIKHYEELSYDTRSLHNRHLRTKRSSGSRPLELKFQAHNRDFHLRLTPSTSLFTKSFTSTHNNGTLDPVDISFIYDGSVVGEPGSHVHGAVILGIFRGTVRIPDDTVYHIEPAYRFYGLKEAQKLPYHSVIYKEEHVDVDPFRHKREADLHAGRCALDKYRDWMVHQTEAEVNIRNKRSYYSYKETMQHNKYSAESNRFESRDKREVGSCSMRIKSTCILYMRSDPTLFNKFKADLNNEVAARDEILSFFASHVSALNEIYGRTKFKPLQRTTPCFQGIQFQIQRTTIMTDETEKCSNELQRTAFCQPNIDVSNFLNLNSLTNHDAFCLAYIFTYRDFSHGTLGLAWVGSPTASAGGICEKYKSYTEGNQQIRKSLNTGIVTIINYNKRVAPRVSQLTFAHEVGHNFGSPHDDGQQCAPYGTSDPSSSGGNYIMFASATQGNLPNNDDFSPCSSDNITGVIDAVFNQRSGKVNCFTESGMAFCGNGIVEEGEECDCGYEEDCTDKCCNPRRTGAAANSDSCTRKSVNSVKYECSPTQGPCCTTECSFISAADNMTCRTRTDCMKEQTCSGNSASCPESVKEDDLKYCNDYSQVCQQGFCTGSLCLKVGTSSSGTTPGDWEECFVTIPGDLTVQQKEQLCYLACRKKNDTGSTCFATSQNLESSNALYTLLEDVNTRKGSSGGIKLPAGSPCNNYQGYCDVFSRCRGVDNEGPLQRLKNLIFNEKTLANIKNWIIEYWWAVLLMAIGLILFMGLFIKFCAVHTPSSNPNAKPALKLTDTLRRRRRNPEQQYRAQGPSGPPPPYSAHGGPPQGHRKGGAKGGRYNNLEMRKV